MSGRAVVVAAGRSSRCRVALVGDGLEILWQVPSAATDLDGIQKNIDDVIDEAGRRSLTLTGLALAISDLTEARDVAVEQGRRHGLRWSVDRMADSLLAGERMLGIVQDAVGIAVLDGDEPAVGLQIGDRAYRGAHGRAGDITHLGLDRTGPIRCGCGLNGCFGALLKAGAAAPEPPRPAFCEAAPLRALGWLAVAAITLVNIINPELLVVSGAVVEDPAELAWFVETVRAGCLGPTRAGLRLVTSAHRAGRSRGHLAKRRVIILVEALERARSGGCLTIGVTAEPTALIGRAAEIIVPTETGPEDAMGKTKGFTTTAFAACRLGHLLAGSKDTTAFDRFPESLGATVERFEGEVKTWVRHLLEVQAIFAVGSGDFVPSAWEGGLKVLEVAKQVVVTKELEEMLHGPFNAVGPTSAFLLMAGAVQRRDRLDAFIKAVTALDLPLLAVTDARTLVPAGGRVLSFALPDLGNTALEAILAVAPLQVLADRLALARGLDPDVSRYPFLYKILAAKSIYV